MATQKQKILRHQKRENKIIHFKDLSKLSKKLSQQGKRIVFTIGTFDLLNPGHCRYLAEAKSVGDVLVVGLANDQSVNRVKGPLYPLINQGLRAELVSYLKSVDYITFTEEDSAHAVIPLLQPHIFYTTGYDTGRHERDDQEEYLVKMFGGKVIKTPLHQPYIGTEKLVEHMANIRVLQILENYIKGHVPDFFLDPNKHLQPADYQDQNPTTKGSFNAYEAIVPLDELEEFGQRTRKKGKTTAFVAGSYDLLHTGHARFIEQAGLMADVLVVGIPSDAVVRYTKGVGRPILNEVSRAYVLGHLDPVDAVVIFDNGTVMPALEKLKPDVFFTVDESWNTGIKRSPEYKLVKSYGGKVAMVERQSPFLSSSAIINKVASEKVKEIFKECMDDEKYAKIVGEQSILKNGTT